MPLSKPSINAGTFQSVSAAASEPNRLITSACASPRADTIAKETSSSVLRTIAGVDLNVFFRQVASPEARAARTSPMQDEADQAFGFIQFLLQLGLRKIRGEATPAHRNVLQIDIYLRRIERDTRVSSRRQYPAPIRIGPGDGGLHQQRIGDAARELPCCVIIGRTADLDGNQLTRAFAVSHNLACQVFHYFGERFAYFRQVFVARRHFSGAVCKN